MNHVLVLNSGSSSLKYAVFEGDREVKRGSIADAHGIGDVLAQVDVASVRAVGHRIVHGGPRHREPELVTDEVLASLTEAIPFAPLHLPMELEIIRAARARLDGIPQVVCFDTAFHRSLPTVAERFALPRALHDAGVRRYGFHGLSYEFVVESLGASTLRRAVIAHLGSGASMAAVRDGVSIDTTMGFTPAGGLVMGTRSGDIDPGIAAYLFDQGGYDAKRFAHLVNRESGLLALSETTSDMQKLLALRASDVRAALAVDVFCYEAAKWIGALTTTLGGIDTLVFTGGIGEHSPEIREQIARGLSHLGVEVDEPRNRASAPVISAIGARCTVRVVATNEERVIARHTERVELSARSGVRA